MISNASVMKKYLARKGRKVPLPKPCKAIIEVMGTSHPALSIVGLGNEPMPVNE